MGGQKQYMYNASMTLKNDGNDFIKASMILLDLQRLPREPPLKQADHWGNWVCGELFVAWRLICAFARQI